MNYFAHGIRYVDRPYFLAGTAVPDWLSAVDRKVRLRSRGVEPFLDVDDPRQSEIAAGVLQHLEDDRWFHQTRAFVETSGILARMFRRILGPEDNFRPGFLGHIVTELILDGVLISQNPRRLDIYYEALNELEPNSVQQAVNRMAKKSTHRLADLIPLFQKEQFLRDYLHPPRLLFRLNQVMRRIKLKPLPDEVEEVLVAGWTVVERRTAELLPENHFSTEFAR